MRAFPKPFLIAYCYESPGRGFVAALIGLEGHQKAQERFEASVNPIIKQRFAPEGDESHSKAIDIAYCFESPGRVFEAAQKIKTNKA
jgi:hypothetical protein